jgi:hypothetical protein
MKKETWKELNTILTKEEILESDYNLKVLSSVSNKKFDINKVTYIEYIFDENYIHINYLDEFGILTWTFANQYNYNKILRIEKLKSL